MRISDWSSDVCSSDLALATTTTEPPVVWPAVAGDAVARAVRTPGGIVLAVREVRADGSYLAVSPCGTDVVVSGEAIAGAHVVLDPGPGGEEPGAVGPGRSEATPVGTRCVIRLDLGGRRDI